jgi:general secretion pathway protein J
MKRCRTSRTMLLQRGFTLLELLLSLALTAMLLSMLSAGVYAVVSDWRRETGGLDSTVDKALTLLQLERALQAAVPHSYVDRERQTRLVYFQGGEDSLSFVSVVSSGRQRGMTAWRLQPDRSGALQLLQTPAFSDNPDARFQALEPQPLLPGYQARFSYLLQRSPDEKEWLDEWDGSVQQSLPRAVRMELVPLARDSNEPPLELLAPIRVWRHAEIEPLQAALP